MVKVLFTTPILEHPAAGGPQLRIENSIKALAQVSDLYMYSRVSSDALGGANAKLFYEQYCKRFYFAPSVTPIARYIRFAKAQLNRLSKRIIKRNMLDVSQEKEFGHLLSALEDIKPDVIWLGYGNISYPLLKYIKSHSDYKVVLDTDSVWSRFVLRALPFAKDREERQRIQKKGREKEEEEKWGTQLADVTTAVSEADADYYRMLAKRANQVHIFSNVIDLETYKQVPPPVEGYRKPCIYLAGTFFSPQSPMVDAARWVVSEVLPLVRQQIRDVHFYIIGKGSDTTLSDIKDPGITTTGKVPSVLPYLCHADVALVPLKWESGTRFKILEAGACGIPVVSTTLGAEGIPVTHGKDILIAGEPEPFANSIIRLITDRDFAVEIAENLRTLVREKYSVASLAQEGRAILEYLTRTSLQSHPWPTQRRATTGDPEVIQTHNIEQAASDLVERICWGGTCLAFIIRASFLPDETAFLTPPDYKQQLGYIVYPAGGEIQRHIHRSLERHIVGTSEVLVVKKGRCEIDIYNDERELVATRELCSGDVLLMVGGGHGFRMLEDTVFLEIKQGPYTGLQEKERF